MAWRVYARLPTFRNPNGAKDKKSQYLIKRLWQILSFYRLGHTLKFLGSPAREPLFSLPQRINSGLLPRGRGELGGYLFLKQSWSQPSWYSIPPSHHFWKCLVPVIPESLGAVQCEMSCISALLTTSLGFSFLNLLSNLPISSF